MLLYQKTNQYFAQIAEEMQELVRDELTELGAREVRSTYRGVRFEADKAALYRINHRSRLISRILAPLATFPCHGPDQLYAAASKIHWPDLLSVDHTFAVYANVHDSDITHSKYAALRVKDAIVDQFRGKFGRRPSVKTIDPDVWFHLYLQQNRATLSLETAGGALHRRGYRKAKLEAPMMETLAAAIIRLSEWDGSQPLYDPMCGSGTLLCEALMHHARIPAGFLRKRFGFERLPDFDAAVWRTVRSEAEQQMRDVPAGLIGGSDAADRAIKAARLNASALPHGDRIGLRQLRFQEIGELRDTVIVCNPPYGVRLGADQDMGGFIESFGDFLKQRCTGSTAYVYFGNRELIKRVGLRTKWKKALKNGALDGRLVKLELY